MIALKDLRPGDEVTLRHTVEEVTVTGKVKLVPERGLDAERLAVGRYFLRYQGGVKPADPNIEILNATRPTPQPPTAPGTTIRVTTPDRRYLAMRTTAVLGDAWMLSTGVSRSPMALATELAKPGMTWEIVE